MAADEQEGRDIGSQGIERSADFIEKKFKEYQIRPFFTTYKDTQTTMNENTYNDNVVGFI